MSLKSMIQSLSDAELIRVFLVFVHNQSLPYQKTVQEIAYKCYEANWILPSGKAMGYGRSEAQAFNQALRNLFDFLLQENNEYNRQIKDILKGTQDCGQIKNKQQLRNQNIQNCTSKNSQSKNPNEPINRRNYIHKTEYDNCQGQVCEEKSKHREQSLKKLTHSKSKQTNLDIGINFQSSKKLTFQTSPSPIKHRINIQGKQGQEKGKIKEKRDIYYSKIVLSKSVHSQQSFNDNQSSKNQTSEQLKTAKEKLKHLETHLATITQANDDLKREIEQFQHREKQSQHSPWPLVLHSNESVVKVQNYLGSQKDMQKAQPSTGATLNKQFSDFESHQKSVEERQNHYNTYKNVSKLKVPKLKLQVLPNYHKKQEKSLNESLLAIYHEKHNQNQKIVH